MPSGMKTIGTILSHPEEVSKRERQREKGSFFFFFPLPFLSFFHFSSSLSFVECVKCVPLLRLSWEALGYTRSKNDVLYGSPTQKGGKKGKKLKYAGIGERIIDSGRRPTG